MPARAIWWPIALASIVVVEGCATAPPAALDRTLMERSGVPPAIAVIPARHAPEADFSSYARGYSEGAAKGAGSGMLTGIALVLQVLAAAGPAAIVVAPVAGAVLAGTAAAGLVAGAAAGAASATPEEQAAAIERLAGSLAAELRLSEGTARVVADSTIRFAGYRSEVVEGMGPTAASDQPDYRALHARGFGGAIEVRASAVGFVAARGADPDLALFLAVEARLVDTSSGRPERLRGLVYQSPAHKVGVWARDDAALAKLELRRAQAALGSHIVDDFLLETESAVGFDVARLPYACGIMPVQPAPNWTSALFGPSVPRIGTANSTTPTLEWETLPSRLSTTTPAPWDNARDRLYDLRIWNEMDGGPGELVYERFGLLQPRHQLEQPLASGAMHFWSVRMRYTVDGHARASRWSASNEPLQKAMPAILDRMFYSRIEGDHAVRQRCFESDLHPCGCLDFIPVPNFYAFRTP
jgi:hypothetical protein